MNTSLDIREYEEIKTRFNTHIENCRQIQRDMLVTLQNRLKHEEQLMAIPYSERLQNPATPGLENTIKELKNIERTLKIQIESEENSLVELLKQMRAFSSNLNYSMQRKHDPSWIKIADDWASIQVLHSKDMMEVLRKLHEIEKRKKQEFEEHERFRANTSLGKMTVIHETLEKMINKYKRNIDDTKLRKIIDEYTNIFKTIDEEASDFQASKKKMAKVENLIQNFKTYLDPKQKAFFEREIKKLAKTFEKAKTAKIVQNKPSSSQSGFRNPQKTTSVASSSNAFKIPEVPKQKRPQTVQIASRSNQLGHPSTSTQQRQVSTSQPSEKPSKSRESTVFSNPAQKILIENIKNVEEAVKSTTQSIVDQKQAENKLNEAILQEVSSEYIAQHERVCELAEEKVEEAKENEAQAVAQANETLAEIIEIESSELQVQAQEALDMMNSFTQQRNESSILSETFLSRRTSGDSQAQNPSASVERSIRTLTNPTSSGFPTKIPIPPSIQGILTYSTKAASSVNVEHPQNIQIPVNQSRPTSTSFAKKTTSGIPAPKVRIQEVKTGSTNLPTIQESQTESQKQKIASQPRFSIRPSVSVSRRSIRNTSKSTKDSRKNDEFVKKVEQIIQKVGNSSIASQKERQNELNILGMPQPAKLPTQSMIKQQSQVTARRRGIPVRTTSKLSPKQLVDVSQQVQKLIDNFFEVLKNRHIEELNCKEIISKSTDERKLELIRQLKKLMKKFEQELEH